MRICGDNKPYAVNLYCTAEEDGEEVDRVYMARFNARGGFSTLRLPFSNFIARVPGDPPLDITQIHSISISYDSRRLPRSSESTVQSDDDSNKTRLEVRETVSALKQRVCYEGNEWDTGREGERARRRTGGPASRGGRGIAPRLNGDITLRPTHRPCIRDTGQCTPPCPAPFRGITGLAGVSARPAGLPHPWGTTSCTRKAAPLTWTDAR